ncbi:GNAT family N-acetyltransferase [Pseudomonas savastanoi]|uniref:Phosphinothricin N-acetyltransferase n=1 Tax=Pseudomonas savastanoi pv. glycinea TaxID=318 RepID=A0A0N8RP46_PSESG|nr:GNAT family N-acetyltransferase [Pseudomonas savastanoi]EFW79832.1 phosphinothricin N-acetyltransferase [Pseudomonas savastanoi pv. glycinea str. B076]KPC22361.1 Phosphinothricin N-acetyltransferase [Pseudomonas savastanoi pv. glycinea]KPC30448.1 Phosphinothricin N-acetyltransferase [Pseudomonas savastanoi pv. glycinea]KPC38073.1 Phosphinothricin N-acetyltransferase [Pseudomonas savastanoi pv. glycinea]KPC39163.1 Phosphinothricin N-acetyltransferase [Pseudomonas savastanoi pv. glycinea]
MTPTFILRDACDQDIPAVQAIYADHVLHGISSFELDPPSVAELLQRRAQVLVNGLPYLVAELAGEVVGYGYATPYRPRPAYRFTVEDSVYVRDGMGGRGIGLALLGELVQRCEQGGWRQMVAVIGISTVSTQRPCLKPTDSNTPTRRKPRRSCRRSDAIFSLMQRMLGDGSGSAPSERA